MRVDYLSMNDAVMRVHAAAAASEALGVHFVNAYTMSLALSDEAYAGLLRQSDLNLPDGRPIVWASALAGLSDVEQVCGPDFMLLALGTDGLRHFFYGSTKPTLDRLERALRSKFPRAKIVGGESPPFRALTSAEEQAVVDRIRDSGANLVWVGLGTPKQDVFVERMKDQIGLPLLAVGAAFDFHAGTRVRPPAWVSRAGLEWSYRLVQEPRRLARRYLIGNARFVAGLASQGVHIED